MHIVQRPCKVLHFSYYLRQDMVGGKIENDSGMTMGELVDLLSRLIKEALEYHGYTPQSLCLVVHGFSKNNLKV